MTSSWYAAMLLYVTVLILGVVAIPCTTQQSRLTIAPFDGLVPQDRDPQIKIHSLDLLPIPVLDNTSFVHYPNVTNINMMGCSVTSVKSGTFDTLWRLKFVDFRYNNINEFPINFGLASQSLVEMNLWDAFSLHTLQPFQFRNLPKLINLNQGFNYWVPFDPSPSRFN